MFTVYTKCVVLKREVQTVQIEIWNSMFPCGVKYIKGLDLIPSTRSVVAKCVIAGLFSFVKLSLEVKVTQKKISLASKRLRII